MKQTLLIVALLAVLVAGAYFILKIDTRIPEQVIGSIETTTFSSTEYGIEFTYPVGSEGYSLNTLDTTTKNPDALATVVLMRTADMYVEQGEGPATINVQVFKNTNNEFPLAWAMKNTEFSNYNLKIGENTETVVGGANALSYTADGLYVSDTVVVAHGEYMYVMHGMYADTQSPLRADFSALVESLTFIPTEAKDMPTVPVQGKLNIDAVCEGALMYMTFTDGASADAFVAECKEGKHPEVIERYKADMNLGDGALI